MHVLLFDIDGTLISSGGAGSRALFRAVKEEFQLNGQTEFKIHGCTDRGIARDVFTNHNLTDDDTNWIRFRDAYLAELPETLATIPGRVLEGVVELLETLSQRNDCVLGLLTGNVKEGAKLKLEHYGLHEYFDFGGFGDDHPDRNDVAKQAFDAASERVENLQPDRVWVIGDTPNDVRCARAIQANAVVVTTGNFKADDFTEHRPDHLWNGLTDIDIWNELLV